MFWYIVDNKQILLDNIDKIHTTKMGIDRIKRNLQIKKDIIPYCIKKIKKDIKTKIN